MADDLLSDFQPDNAAPLAVNGASGNADSAGQAISLSKKSGVPASIIDGDLEGFVQQEKARRAGQAVRSNPSIAGYVQSTPLAAKVSNDDYDSLDKTSGAISDFNKIRDIPYSERLELWAQERYKLEDYPGFIVGRVSKFLAGLPEMAYRAVTAEGDVLWGKGLTPEEQVSRALDTTLMFGILPSVPKVTPRPGTALTTIEGEGPKYSSGPRSTMEGIAEYYGEHKKEDIAGWSDSQLREYVAKKTNETPIRPGVHPDVDKFHVDQQKLDEKHFDRVMNEAEASKTKERSPDAFSDFAKQHDSGDISISADAISKIYESEGKAPEAGDGLFGFIPDIADQLRTGLASGVDVKVPVADYVAHVDQALHGKIKDAIRYRDEGVTKEEAQAMGEVPESEFKPEEGEKITGVEGDQYTTSAGRTVTREQALAIARESGDFAADRGDWAMIAAGYDPKVLHRDDLSFGARERIERAAAAENSLYLNPLFKSGKDLNITEGEFKRYSDKIENRQKELMDRAVEAARREVAKRQTAEWRKAENELSTRVAVDYRSRPDIVADRFLRSGDLPTGERLEPVKLEAKIVEDQLGKEHSIKDLTAEKGANPDDVATFLGFDSGNEMLKVLDEYNKGRKTLGLGPKAYFDQIVSKEVDQQMREKFGLLPENILAEAREQALADYHADILSDEVRILARQAGGEPPLSKRAIKEWVSNNFEAQKVSQVRDWEPLRRAVEKGGRDAEKALLAGDFEGAFKAKQRQLLAFLGAREAANFGRDRERTGRLIDRVTDEGAPKTLDADTVYQSRRMLGNLGVKDTGFIKDGLIDFNQFVANSEGQLAVADFLTDPSFRKTMGDLTVREYRDLMKSLQSLVHVAREAKQLDSIRGKADLDNVVFDVKKELDRFNLIEQPLNPSVPQRIRSFGRYVTGMHLLVERVLDYTDKYNPNGPLTTYLDRPLRAAYNKEIQIMEMAVKHLRDLKQYVDSSLGDRLENTVIPNPLAKNGLMDMTRQNLRQLMLPMGSRSGVQKVVDGFGIDEMKLRKFVHDNASEADVKWVKGMWELFAKLKPLADEVQLRDTGVPVDSVEFSSITTKHGKLDGGYSPIIYDKDRSNIEGDIRAQNPTFDEHYVTATTPQGYTRRRTGYAAPLDLEGLFLGSKIQGMVHDIAFREAIRNSSKLINNEDFMLEFRKKWGTEVADLLPGWLKDIANVHNVDDNYARGLVRGLAFFRQNVVSALIALNPGTYIKHGVTAASMSVQRVGGKELANAVKEIVSDGKELAQADIPKLDEDFVSALKDVTSNTERGNRTRQFILDSSPVMRQRWRTYADTISGAYEQATNYGLGQKFRDVRQKAMYIGRYPVAFSDALSAMPTWLAAYNKEFGRTGDHAQAVFVADKDVSRAHGSSFIGDKPAVMRQKNNLGGEALRWATPLYNFWNHMANNYFQAAWDVASMARGKPEPNATGRDLANRAFWLFVIPLMVEEMASPALDEHKESLGVRSLKALARHVGGSFVGLRDITNAFAGGYEPSVGLIGTVGKALANVGRDINRGVAGKALRKDWMTDAATFLGFATGIGGPQIGKTGGFMVDVATGRDRPKTFNEWRQGLRTGHSRARSF